jgi:hypothetical protein
MKTSYATGGATEQGTATLATTFATRQQAESLLQGLVLTEQEIEQVSGGGDFSYIALSSYLVDKVFPIPLACMPVDISINTISSVNMGIVGRVSQS